MQHVIFIFRWVIILMVAATFLGISYIFILIASEDEERYHSAKMFFLNIVSCLLGLGKLVVYVAVLYAFVWCCSFITKPPCANIVRKADGGYLLSDSSMVCDSNDSTRYYTVKSKSKSDIPGRVIRCIQCGRIYNLHYRWLNEEERKHKKNNDGITREIIHGLAVDPI